MGWFSSRPTGYELEMLDFLERLVGAAERANEIGNELLTLMHQQVQSQSGKATSHPLITNKPLSASDQAALTVGPLKPVAKPKAKKKVGEFYSFDDVMQVLNIDENRLKRFVSEGEIRAFREGDQMKFKVKEIEALLARTSQPFAELDR